MRTLSHALWPTALKVRTLLLTHERSTKRENVYKMLNLMGMKEIATPLSPLRQEQTPVSGEGRPQAIRKRVRQRKTQTGCLAGHIVEACTQSCALLYHKHQER